jgi:hypothetical protein
MTNSGENSRAMAARAARKLKERAGALASDAPAIKQEALIDKHRFIELLNLNFIRLDKNGSNGISRTELIQALSNLGDYTADESITLLLALRYFDFISDLVDDGDSGDEKVISRADVETLAAFLVHSDMTLEALCQWCSGGTPTEDADSETGADLMAPPPES